MYTKRVQIVNYGPIDRLDITFPFENDSPKPVLLVGENGSGKSILLSHIVNGLVSAKGVAYPDTPEVETGKVYKLRSNSYIKLGSEYYFGRVDFEDGLFVTELRSKRKKREYGDLPPGLSEPDIQYVWNKMNSEKTDHIDSGFIPQNEDTVRGIFSERCVLYFPHNRFEEPAWLNEDNLKTRAQYMDQKHMQGQTERTVINYSPLHENQNWLFDLLFDRAVFEIQTTRLSLPVNNSNTTIPLPVFSGYSGVATSTYETTLRIVQNVVRRDNARIGVGRWQDRRIFIESDTAQLVPNIFQLSSGETALLNLFLSILRDFGLCGAHFSNVVDVRGIVVVDEIDLHLHSVHQYEVLPQLIRLFPNVQFVVTTHSPLFVLGMRQVFGEDGFGLYRLPQGRQISPEEFSEFGNAYQAFAVTRTFNEDMQAAIEDSHKPIVFVEGTTDQKYIEKASTLLGKATIMEGLDIRDGGGSGKLTKIWKDSVLPLTETLPYRVLLIFDCDTCRQVDNKGRLFQRSIPMQNQNPIKTGIENLFSKSTLERARQHKPAFFITEEEHGGTNKDGQPITIPEKWVVNESEKADLCEWLCKNGMEEDFNHFELVFVLIEEALELIDSESAGGETEGTI